jgi:hypothetical protein
MNPTGSAFRKIDQAAETSRQGKTNPRRFGADLF